MEEASEVVQATCKVKQFGLDEFYIPADATNQQRLEAEMKDLITVGRLLETKYGFDFGITLQDPSYEQAKIEKINKYSNVSKIYGLYKDD